MKSLLAADGKKLPAISFPIKVPLSFYHHEQLIWIDEAVSNLFGLFSCVIRRASQRAGLHVLESQAHSDVAPVTEFFRRDVALNRQAARVRLEILADRHDVAGSGAQVFH